MINKEIHYLLTKREDNPSDPYPNAWGMSGVYVNATLDESYEDVAIRALRDKAHLSKIPFLEQLQSFGNRERDPRHWTGTLVYIGYVNVDEVELKGNDVRWVAISELDSIDNWAFDHKDILKYAMSKIKEQAQYSTQVINLLGDKFTQPQLQELYEIVLEEALDKSSFRKQIRDSELLTEIEGETLQQSKGAPAKLYAINKEFAGFFFPRSIVKKQNKAK